MVVSKRDASFAGRPVEAWSSEVGIRDHEAAIRIGLDYDQWEDGARIHDAITELCEDPKAPLIEALVIGPWSFEPDDTPSELYTRLASPDVVACLSNLKALFVGDITYEEQEISWITQSDVGPVIAAYPALEVLRVRGGNSLQLTGLASPVMKTLIIESGALSRAVIEQVCGAKLPALEHLELWLGSENYGADHSIDDLMPILSGRLFPKLRYLGLRDAEYSDDIARVAADSPVLGQLETFDLSMGTFGDDGAEALIASAQVKKLKTLDVSHHYMTPDTAARLAKCGANVVANDPQPADQERYVQVAE